MFVKPSGAHWHMEASCHQGALARLLSTVDEGEYTVLTVSLCPDWKLVTSDLGAVSGTDGNDLGNVGELNEMWASGSFHGLFTISVMSENIGCVFREGGRECSTYYIAGGVTEVHALCGSQPPHLCK